MPPIEALTPSEAATPPAVVPQSVGVPQSEVSLRTKGSAVGPERPDGSGGKGHSVANLAQIGAGIAGLTLLALAPRQRSGGRWACVGLGSALVGGAVLGWARAKGHHEPRALRLVEGLQLTSSLEETYALWRDFERWPSFMSHLESVEPAGSGSWRWTAKLPGLPKLQWTSELVQDEPGQALAWRPLPGGHLDHEGRVTFKRLPSGRGTGVHLDLSYVPPAGAAGRQLAALLQPAAERLIRADLRRLKSLLEAGEIPVNVARAGDSEEGDR